MRAASGMARTIDRRCPRALNDDQLAEVYRHPEVKLLQRVKEGLKRRIRAKYGTISRARGTRSYMHYREAYRQVQSKKKAVNKAMLREIKAKYREEQPVADIVSQLGGPSTKNEHSEAEQGPRDRLGRSASAPSLRSSHLRNMTRSKNARVGRRR